MKRGCLLPCRIGSSSSASPGELEHKLDDGGIGRSVNAASPIIAIDQTSKAPEVRAQPKFE